MSTAPTAPERVKPVRSTLDAAEKFDCEFPPDSFTIVRLSRQRNRSPTVRERLHQKDAAMTVNQEKTG